MGGTNYNRLHEKQMDNLIEQNESLQKELKELRLEMKEMRLENKELVSSLMRQIKTRDEMIEKLLIEIDRLQQQNKKDSGNSSKPSGTNGSKKIVTNRREKSDKKPGGQVGHKAHTLKIDEITKLKENKNVIYKEVDEYHISGAEYVIDVDVNVTLTKYSKHINTLNPVQYGNRIKSICTLLSADNYCSTDGIVKFISSITNGSINLSKGTIINWNEEFSSKLSNEINTIEQTLLNSYYNNVDDSTIKINGENYCQIVTCNNNASRLWIHKHKSIEALQEIDYLPHYIGILVKDAASVYSSFGNKVAQCLSHILRYLKGIYELNNRPEAKALADFLTAINNERNELILSGITSYTKERIAEIEKVYFELINKWKLAYKKDTRKFYDNDEVNLFNRMEGKHKDEILYFIHDFKVPSTNNQAEVDQRGIKIKQKIGKFRSFEGAETYAIAKSFILTIKKQGYQVFESIQKIFNKEKVLEII